MKETSATIPLTTKGKYIYGTLRGDIKDKRVIILCHGYGGWMHEMLLYNAARYFDESGYSTLRLSMYGGGDNARDIVESDVMTHAADIDSVVRYVKEQGAAWTSVIGHSFSGLSILYSKEQAFDAAALWDPTHTDSYAKADAIESLRKDFIFVAKLNAYVSGKGSGYVYAKTVFDNNYPKSQELAPQFSVPTCVINASWSKEQQQCGQQYAEQINAKTEHVVIPESSHPFTEEGAAERLFAATADFFDSLQ